MVLVFLLLFLVFAVAGAEIEPSRDGEFVLLGPWTALVGMQHPQQDEAETGSTSLSHYRNYAAHACGAWTCCVPSAFACATPTGYSDS